jgi:hypothetical protein
LTGLLGDLAGPRGLGWRGLRGGRRGRARLLL